MHLQSGLRESIRMNLNKLTSIGTGEVVDVNGVDYKMTYIHTIGVEEIVIKLICINKQFIREYKEL